MDGQADPTHCRQKVLADGTRDGAGRRRYEFNDPPHP